MTRYTDVARKRTYVEAGLNYRDSEGQDEVGPPHSNAPVNISETTNNETDEPKHQPKRKRRKTKSGSTNLSEGDRAQIEGGEHAGQDGSIGENGEGSTEQKNATNFENPVSKRGKGQSQMKHSRLKGYETRKAASENRRLKRQDERSADTTCYACREKGHAARHCPKALASTTLDNDANIPQKLGRQTVGICYRCGSRKHNLSKCKKSVDPKNPLPFSSCFVCSEKGHLASACPQNQSKGVYPNGGSCKLCGETTHLAKNCSLRKAEVVSTMTFLGTGDGAGADEDDFHTFKRRNNDVARDEKVEERRRKQQAVKVGAHSGVVRAFGPTAAPQPRKVVIF